jgi:hypothetical protein
METNTPIEDIGDCMREGRRPAESGSYRIRTASEDLEFAATIITDPVPTGRQIIEATGRRKAEHHLVFQMLPNGELEELRLEETTDLREARVERFLIFRSAESFRLDLDGKRLEWGCRIVSGRVLKRLAGVDPGRFGVWQKVRGQNDRLIADDELVRLDEAGLEQFFTEIKVKTVTVIVNGRPKPVPKNAELSYRDVVILAFGDVPENECIDHSVTYSRGTGNKPTGTLRQGQAVKAKDGMEFDVTQTNRS